MGLHIENNIKDIITFEDIPNYQKRP